MHRCRIVQRVLLDTGAVLGTVCLLFAAAALIFGLTPLIFASGSMGPSIPTGSLGLAVPVRVADLVPGDVVSVVNSEGTRITHRVVENRQDGLILKGDANPVADLQPYVTENADKLVFSVPFLGHVVSWLSTPWAYFLGGLLAAYLLYVAFFKGSNSHTTEGGTTPAKALRTLAIVLVFGITGALVMHSQSFQVTQAAFTNSAQATSGMLTAQSMPPIPGKLSCKTTGGVLGAATNAEVSWTAPDNLPPGAKYAVRVQSVSGAVRYLSVNSGTHMLSFNGGLNLLGALLGSAQTFEVRVLAALTTDGAAVNELGTNLGWTSVINSAPAISVKYSPGVLILDSYSCA